MCDPVTATLVTSAVIGSYSQQQQGEYANDVAKFNARQQENDATRVRNKGLEAEQASREKTAQLTSLQRAQLGASGVDVESGSAFSLQQDTETQGEVDALRIRGNFLDKAQVLDDTAVLTRDQGRNAERAGNFGAFASLLGGGAQAAQVNSKWYQPSSAGGTQ